MHSENNGEEVMKALAPLHLQNYAPSCLFQVNTVVMYFKFSVTLSSVIKGLSKPLLTFWTRPATWLHCVHEPIHCIYHTSNSRECIGVNGESLQLHAVYKKPYFLLQVTRESVSVLQVTWESVSGTASHTRCVWTCNEIESSYDKIIITIVPSYTRKNITRLLPLAMLLVLCTCNNTDGNKLVIFSGIASYYGDNYIWSWCIPAIYWGIQDTQL